MTQQVYAIVQKQAGSYSVMELCHMYGVSRSGYYKWLTRGNEPNRYEQGQAELDRCVYDIHAHFPSMGYRQIRDTLLLQTGWRVCDISVWKSMKRLGVKGYVRRRKQLARPGCEHEVFPNILNRDFHADRPMQKVATDITFLKYKSKWFYLVCFLDLFNNEIVEWQLSQSSDCTFVCQAAKRLLEKTKCTGRPVLLHSDQGTQYISSGYQALLKQYGAVQSMSRAGTPRDNAVIESFFGRFKDVLRFQFRYWKADDLNAVVCDAIHYFNSVRPLRKLNGKPPVQFRIEQVA